MVGGWGALGIERGGGDEWVEEGEVMVGEVLVRGVGLVVEPCRFEFGVGVEVEGVAGRFLRRK